MSALLLSLLWCAPLVHAQPTGLFPDLQKNLVGYGEASDDARDALVRAHRDELVDCFRRLLRVAVSDRADLEDTEVAGDAAANVRDFADRIEKLFQIDAFTVDARTVLNLSDRDLRVRGRLHADVFRLMRVITGTEEASRAEVVARTGRLDEVLGRVAAFAKRHDDRDFARFGSIIRTLASRFRVDRGTPAGQARHRADLESLGSTLAQQGLDGDKTYFVAEHSLAAAYLNAGDLGKMGAALRAARRCAAHARIPIDFRANLLGLELEYFKGRAYAHAALDSARSLEELLPKLQTLAETHRSPQYRRALLLNIGDWYVQVAFARSANGDHDRAYALLQTALRRPGLRNEQHARLNVLLAQECETLGDYRGGVRAAQRAVKLARSAGIKWQARLHEAACQALRGWVGDARKALEAADKLSLLAAPIPDKTRLVSRSCLVRALVRKMDGDLEGALASCAAALKTLGDNATNSDRVRALWFRSAIQLQIGESTEALETAHLAREAAEDADVNRDWQIFVSDLGIADILLSSGRSDEAQDRLDDALRDGDAFLHSQPALRGEARRMRSEAKWKKLSTPERGETEEIGKLIDEIMDAVADLKRQGRRGPFGLPRIAAETLRAYELVLEIRLARSEPFEAVAEEAQAYLESLDRPPGGRHLVWTEVDATLNIILARVFEAKGERDQALTHYEKAAKLESRLREGLRWRAPDGLSARFESVHDRMAGLHLELAMGHGPARAREALLFLEGLRAKSLRTLIAAAEARLARRAAKPEGIRLRAPRRVDARTLKGLMKEDRAVLVYALTGRGAYVIGLRGSRIDVQKIESDRIGLERLTMSLLSSHQGEPDGYKADAAIDFGRLLYQQLIAPVAHIVSGAREVVIVPDGIIHAVPFAALVTSPTEKVTSMDFTKVPFLLKRKGLDAITVVPSLGTLALLNERSTARPGRSALLIGDPVLGDPSLPRLPHALREIETIGKLHHNPVTLAGAAATRARLDATKPGRFGTLHFATHTHRGRMPAILLGPESAGAGPVALTPNDVMGLDLADTNLVVLSACASGRGRVMGTEGLIGLPRAFLIAGARRVVASTVSVVDEKTSALMGSFYGQLKNGQAPAAALLAAQRDLLGRGTTSWPGYWGSFFVVGAP